MESLLAFLPAIIACGALFLFLYLDHVGTINISTGLDYFFPAKARMRRRIKRSKCPYCMAPFVLTDAISSCSVCRTLHHGECWKVAGGCTVFGCTSNTADPIVPL